MTAVERALLSVFDKSGLVSFAHGLAALGIELISTGGTAELLRQSGLAVREVAEVTGYAEMLGGRVKTLHPRIHGGILGRRSDPIHRREMANHGIPRIDLVVVNLYPFETVAGQPGVTVEELLENVDIGGPAMLRSAGKNFSDVAVVTDPADYASVLEELGKSERSLSLATRLRLAKKAFALTAHYDGAIAMTLERLAANESVKLAEPPVHLPRLFFDFELRHSLRYGENPHQQAAFYVPRGGVHGFAGSRQLHGKELSYNNLLDLDAAWNLVEEFSLPAAVIIKHTNPCGASEQATLAEAYRKAYECDPVSAFGSVLGFNQAVDRATAEEIGKTFVEAVIAPGYHPEALAHLQTKKNIRLMEMPSRSFGTADKSVRPAGGGTDMHDGLKLVSPNWQMRSIRGGILIQEADRQTLPESEWKVVTRRPPTPAEADDLRFAWIVSKHVKSNAIVFARSHQVAGVGAGQMSRVDSVKIAVMKAAAAGLPLAPPSAGLAGTVVASDAFFPFPDGVEEAAKAGATAVIQPGGSVRDSEVIGTADRLGLAMVFTGMRHFRH